MGNCCTKSAIPELSDTVTKLTVYGDYFDRDTRGLLAICDLCEVSVNLQLICTFNGANLETRYAEVNQSGKIPTLMLGRNKSTTDRDI